MEPGKKGFIYERVRLKKINVIYFKVKHSDTDKLIGVDCGEWEGRMFLNHWHHCRCRSGNPVLQRFQPNFFYCGACGSGDVYFNHSPV